MFVDKLVRKFYVIFEQKVPLQVGVKLLIETFDEEVENWPFRKLVGS